MGIEEFAFGLVIEIVGAAIERGVDLSVLPYFKRSKIKRRVEEATAEVVEPLLPFLEQERIPEDKQYRLIETCVSELRPLSEQPELLFQGSLNGQKIFEQLYSKRDLPQVIVEDGLKDVYTLLFPRVATLLCKIPAAVKDWENEAWSENFRRLDEITAQMLNLFSRVDELASLPLRGADESLMILRRTLAQKIRIELDLTGLRADRPVEVKFADLFVFPEIVRTVNPRTRQAFVLSTRDMCFNALIGPDKFSIVVGAPGAGKSTWSKWLQQEALSPRWNGIAVRVELRRFSGEPLISLHELIREAAGKHLAEDVNAERVGRWLDARQVIFILDGFDEIPARVRDEVQAWVVDLQLAARGCPFVLTSRVLTTDHLERFGKGWMRWVIEPFDEERVVDYITRWYDSMPLLSEAEREVDAASLASTWSEDPTIGPLTGNPLLLSTLLMVHHLDGKLPSGRAQLYRRYVEGMLGVWDDRRRVEAASVQIPLEKKKQILRGLALRMFLQDRDQLEEPATVDIVEFLIRELNVQATAADTLAILRERSGLLIGPGVYSFIHKTVAEFLVAEAIVQGDQRDDQGVRIDRFKLFEQRGDDRWNTVTFLWAGLAPVSDVESFVDACIEAEAFPLAYGLLHDQYERITAETRRRVFRELTSGRNVPPLQLDFMHWAYSRPAGFYSRLTVPYCELRSISGYAALHVLLRRACRDEPHIFSGYAQAPNELRDLLWMVTTMIPADVQLWREFLKEPFPETGDKRQWLALISERAVWEALNNNVSHTLTEIIRGFVDVFPQDYGVAGLELMSSIVESGHQISPHRLREALRVLTEIGTDSINTDWLRGTDEWDFAERAEDFDVITADLLEAFTSRLGQFLKGAGADEIETYKRAILYAEELRSKRQGHIISNQSNSAGDES